MKIVVPADEKQPEMPVSVSFGRAPYFIIYDTDSALYTAAVNPGADASGGAGVKAAQAAADAGAEAVITFRCGENAVELFNTAGITLYTAVSGSVADNIGLCTGGKLAVLHDIHPGLHHAGDRPE
jgi:predicted Fe-Mo cluster-binding NifX family protein